MSPHQLRDRERAHPVLLALVLGAFALVCVAVPAPPAQASAWDPEPATIALDLRPSTLWARRQARLANATERDIACRTQALMLEIRSLAPRHPWAGSYYRGDGLGVNVRLLAAPRGGALVTWRGCMGLYGWNWGPITTDGDTLHIEYQLPADAGMGAGFSADYRVSSLDDGVSLDAVGRHERLVRDR